MNSRIIIMALGTAIVACDQPTTAPTFDPDRASVIYGTDNRRDVYEVTDADLLDMADGTVAMVGTWQLSPNNNGTWDLFGGSSLQSSQGVCSNEPFASQPTHGSCSGFLIAPDLVATAGHCISNSSCNNEAFVFDYQMNSANSVNDTLDDNDVYFCDNIVARQLTGPRDYAVVQLDRPVTGHTILPVSDTAPPLNADLVLLGYPSGLPLKIANGGSVQGISSTEFDADVDSYGGNSGSPIVDRNTGLVQGILVEGSQDYVWAGGCYESNVCSSVVGCPGFETATRADLISSYGVAGPIAPPTPSCVEDAFEPNSSTSDATTLPVGSSLSASACANNDDVFAIDVSAGDTLRVDLDFVHATGDLDLALYDQSGSQVEVSESTSDDESITWTFNSGGTVYAQVYGYNGAEANYTVTATVAGSSPTLSLSSTSAVGGGTVTFLASNATSSPVWLVYGTPGGSTPIPGCANVSVDLGPVAALGQFNATSTIAVGVPASLTGQTFHFAAIDLGACEVSAPLAVTIQ